MDDRDLPDIGSDPHGTARYVIMMMRIRLNGWQRTGVVLSIVWMLSIGGCGALEYLQVGEPTYYFVDTVEVHLPPAKDVDRPGRELSLEEFMGIHAERHFRVDRLIAAMLVPLVLIWAFAYVCVFVIRWVAAGFKKNGT
jgi:hypothetical protein